MSSSFFKKLIHISAVWIFDTWHTHDNMTRLKCFLLTNVFSQYIHWISIETAFSDTFMHICVCIELLVVVKLFIVLRSDNNHHFVESATKYTVFLTYFTLLSQVSSSPFPDQIEVGKTNKNERIFYLYSLNSQLSVPSGSTQIRVPMIESCKFWTRRV